MQIKNFLSSANTAYSKFYTPDYFKTADYRGMLRYQDQWPAVCYAHGIFNPPELANVHYQIQYLTQARKRVPTGILDIGAGRGEVGCALAQMYPVTGIDVNPSAGQFHINQATKMFGSETGSNHVLFLGDLINTVEHIDLSNFDTVIMTESIEHIYTDEWQKFLDIALPYFRSNNTHLVITNFKNMWPLGYQYDGVADHVSVIDDTFYDNLATLGQTLFRDKSHICIKF